MTNEKKRLFAGLIVPVFFVILIWLIKLVEIVFNLNFTQLGIFPLRLQTLRGIITYPLIHGDLEHLISNTFPVFFLLLGLFYFYREISWQVFAFVYLAGGFWLWLFGRESYHIGASGLIYGLVAFLFFSGIIRKHKPLTAISLLVAFLYGGILWGLLPSVDEHISWEGHLTGFIAGTLIAFYYKKTKPYRSKNKNKENMETYLNGDFSTYHNTGGFEEIIYSQKKDIPNLNS